MPKQTHSTQEKDEPTTRREYAEGRARQLYPAAPDRDRRDLMARLLDRELSRNYTKSGDRR